MSSDKKLTLKRLVIFLVISFLPFCIIIPIMWAYYGEPIYASENPDVMIATYPLGVFGMLVPSLANLITRLVTKEGFKNSYLGANFKGRMGYWTASVVVKLAEAVLCAILLWVLFFDGMSFSDAFPNFSIDRVGMFLLQLAFSVICFFPGFGEEWGWRGYMMPKLLELMPKPAAVVVGGIIWGLWHAPLTVAGHNFGVDYPGYPFVGIGLMCLMCTLMNIFLTLLTEKTKSVYPAAFCHAVNNNLNMGIMLSLFGSEAAMEKLNSLSEIEGMLPYLGIMLITATVSTVLLMQDKRKSDTLQQNA